jgi:hemoglobin-like flavoprotein
MLPQHALSLPKDIQRHVEHVRRSWAIVVKDPENGVMLYQRLYENEPSLRHMFDGVDIVLQSHLFMDMFTKIIELLGTVNAVRMLKAAGRRHARFGVSDQHYTAVGNCLMWMIERALGNGFTSEVKAAWDWLYSVVEQNMRSGAFSAPLTSGGNLKTVVEQQSKKLAAKDEELRFLKLQLEAMKIVSSKEYKSSHS